MVWCGFDGKIVTIKCIQMEIKIINKIQPTRLSSQELSKNRSLFIDKWIIIIRFTFAANSFDSDKTDQNVYVNVLMTNENQSASALRCAHGENYKFSDFI